MKKRKTVWSTLTSSAALALAGVTGVTSLALHSLPTLAVGAIALSALVAWERASAEAPTALGSCKVRRPTAFEDPDTRAAVAAIHAAHAALAAAVDDRTRDLPVELDGALEAVRELERHADTLAGRADEIARHFAATDAASLHRDASVLARRVESTRDRETRTHYEAARASRVAQLGALDDLGRSKERLIAVLSAIGATLEAMPARVLWARGLGTGADVAKDVRRELDTVTIEIASMQDALHTLEQTET